MAVQYLKPWGAKCVCFTSSKDKIDELKKMGADEVVVTTEEGAVEKMAGKIDVLLNYIPTADDAMFEKYVPTLASMGTWVQIAVPPVGQTVKFNLGIPVLTGQKFCGSLVGPKHLIIEMLEFSAKHKCHPICEQFDFEDFQKAYNRLAFERPRFRCVVKFNHNL
jgi:uncharacterized zinc-type alcohol dehydrogenase-like protein